MCERQSRKGGGGPIFINMKILPDVKSLEDILAHPLAGQFKHALPADLKYLGCLSRQLSSKQSCTGRSAAAEDMNSELMC